jgi:hypothetical protein
MVACVSFPRIPPSSPSVIVKPLKVQDGVSVPEKVTTEPLLPPSIIVVAGLLILV